MLERWSTRRRRAELALRESDERYRALFYDNPHATFSLTPDGRFEDANRVALAHSGLTLEELRGRHFDDLVDAAALPGAVSAFQAALRGEPQKARTVVHDAAGGRLVLNVALVPVVIDGALVAVHGVAEDMTAEDALLRELEEAQRRAAVADAAKEDFLTNISHEVRTPLSTLLGAAEMLGDGDLDADQRHLVELVQRSGLRLLVLVDDVLDVSRLGAGDVRLRRQDITVASVVDDLLAWAVPSAEHRGIGLRHVVEPDAPRTLQGDPERLSQLLCNLVGNAVKFTDSGSVTIRVAGGTGDSGDVVVFEVEDTGDGFPETSLDHLFEPFTQLDAGTTRRHGGAGLGLSICRELVALMGGHLTATSTLGVGSRFTVALPVTCPLAAQQQAVS